MVKNNADRAALAEGAVQEFWKAAFGDADEGEDCVTVVGDLIGNLCHYADLDPEASAAHVLAAGIGHYLDERLDESGAASALPSSFDSFLEIVAAVRHG